MASTVRTKEEAIARAKHWLTKFLSEYPEEWNDIPLPSSDAKLLHDTSHGYILVLERGGDDEGTVVAVENYNARMKDFHWDEDHN